MGNTMNTERKSMLKPIIAIVVAVVVVLAVLTGLNLAGITNIPFLPRNPAIALARSLDNVTHDGKFDIAVKADSDAELTVDLNGQKVKCDVDLALDADGTARDFDNRDLTKLTITDGDFAADTALSYNIGPLNGKTDDLHSAGTFNLTVAKGTLDYALKQPVSYEGTLMFDPRALMGTGQGGSGGSGGSGDGSGSLSLQDIKDVKMEGDVISFTLNATSLSSDDAAELLGGILQPVGATAENAKAEVSDLNVRIDLGTPNSVRANVIGTMKMSAHGKMSGDLPLDLPNIPLEADLELLIPLDIGLVIS